MITPDVRQDYVKWWHHSYNPMLVTSAFIPTSSYIYFTPFEVSSLQRIWPANIRFKFDWSPSGMGYSFIFRIGVYKLMRGTGGTANTLVLIAQLGAVARTAPSLPSTEYIPTATSASGPLILDDGIYFMAFQWQDTSLPGSSVSFSAFGTTFPSTGGWVYYGDGTTIGSLPAIIATLGVATTFQIYFGI